MRKTIFAVTTAAVVVTGCGRDGVPSQLGNAPSAFSQRAVPAPAAPSPLLYVANYQSGGSNVLVFADSGKTLKRTVALPYPDVEGVAAGAGGNLFALSGNEFTLHQQSISVFKNDGAKPVKTIQQRFPFEGVTVDSSGNLFAGCGQAARRVCEYAAAKKGVVGGRVVRKIQLEDYGVTGTHLTTDASGDLAVSDQNHVTLFAPGATTPYLDMTLNQREISIDGVAFDQSGNLFVAYEGYYDSYGISEYAPGSSSTPIRSFSVPSKGEPASKLAFDAAGNLYALLPVRSGYSGSPEVVVFAPNANQPFRTITKGLENVKGYPTMAVDASGEIYVAVSGGTSAHGSVVVYAPNQSKPRRVITTGIGIPEALALAP